MRILSNWFNTCWNVVKRITICSWNGHDYCKPYCFRCWQWFPAEFWEVKK